jgi:hypothetical protein
MRFSTCANIGPFAEPTIKPPISSVDTSFRVARTTLVTVPRPTPRADFSSSGSFRPTTMRCGCSASKNISMPSTMHNTFLQIGLRNRDSSKARARNLGACLLTALTVVGGSKGS